MEIIEKLPDDIVLYIYTKCIKRYRFDNGKLIKLIDLEKYSFLEKYICRRVVSFCKSYPTFLMDTDARDVSVKKYRIQFSIPNVSEILNRKELYIDDDMICIDLTENENSLHYDVTRFRLKKIEPKEKKRPSIYYRGKLIDYDWHTFCYSYSIY
jgi:hypothetical protein